MRLAQAARKLSITTEDIIDFLEIRGIVIERDSNTKLGEEAVQMLWKHFEVEEELENEKVIAEEETEANLSEDDSQEASSPVIEDVEDEPGKDNIENQEKEEPKEGSDLISEVDSTRKKSFKTVGELLESDEKETDDDLVIKPAKIELKGLNVVGKIDLPEPKPKPEPEPKEELERKEKKSSSKPKPRKLPRRKKPELSPTEIRKREEQKEARKRERIEKEKKKKREQFYKEKILKPKQIEQKRKPQKKKEEVKENAGVQKPQPKTLLGKFWRWLNT